jgi:hypothetical protein
MLRSWTRMLGCAFAVTAVPMLTGANVGQCCKTDSDCIDPTPCVALVCESSRCQLAPEQPTGCCVTSTQCDDGNPCTQDTCQGGQCTHTVFKDCCRSYSDSCSDGNPCTDDFCCTASGCPLSPHEGAFHCEHRRIPGCCQQDSDCVHCWPDKVCVEGWCRYPLPDGLPCTDLTGCQPDLPQDWIWNCLTQTNQIACSDGTCSVVAADNCCSQDADCPYPCTDPACSSLDTSVPHFCTRSLCPKHNTCQHNSLPWCRFDFECQTDSPLAVGRCIVDSCRSPRCVYEIAGEPEICPPTCVQKPELCLNNCNDGNICTIDRCRRTQDILDELNDGYGYVPPVGSPPLPPAICHHLPVPGCCNHGSDCQPPGPCHDVLCFHNANADQLGFGPACLLG